MNSYPLGNLIRVTAAFTSFTTGMPLDPDVVMLSVLDATGTLTTYTFGSGGMIVKDSIGDYHADLNGNSAGIWSYRWWSTGNGQAALEKQFQVKRAAAVAP